MVEYEIAVKHKEMILKMNSLLGKVVATAMALSVAAGVLLPYGSAPSNASKYSFTGETSNTTSDILFNGKETGAELTTIHLDAGTAGYASKSTGRLISIVEADLSNTNLSLEVINHGTYIKNSGYLTDIVDNYDEDGKTILAAVNGDWMHLSNGTDAHNMNVGSVKNFRVATGVMIIDGEIWNSQITSQEVSYDGPYSFGVTKDNQPIIGLLKVNTTVTINGTSFAADGLNRAPAKNALYVYNERLNDATYAAADAYELLSLQHRRYALQ